MYIFFPRNKGRLNIDVLLLVLRTCTKTKKNMTIIERRRGTIGIEKAGDAAQCSVRVRK